MLNFATLPKQAIDTITTPKRMSNKVEMDRCQQDSEDHDTVSSPRVDTYSNTDIAKSAHHANDSSSARVNNNASKAPKKVRFAQVLKTVQDEMAVESTYDDSIKHYSEQDQKNNQKLFNAARVVKSGIDYACPLAGTVVGGASALVMAANHASVTAKHQIMSGAYELSGFDQFADLTKHLKLTKAYSDASEEDRKVALEILHNEGSWTARFSRLPQTIRHVIQLVEGHEKKHKHTGASNLDYNTNEMFEKDRGQGKWKCNDYEGIEPHYISNASNQMQPLRFGYCVVINKKGGVKKETEVDTKSVVSNPCLVQFVFDSKEVKGWIDVDIDKTGPNSKTSNPSFPAHVLGGMREITAAYSSDGEQYPIPSEMSDEFIYVAQNFQALAETSSRFMGHNGKNLSVKIANWFAHYLCDNHETLSESDGGDETQSFYSMFCNGLKTCAQSVLLTMLKYPALVLAYLLEWPVFTTILLGLSYALRSFVCIYMFNQDLGWSFMVEKVRNAFISKLTGIFAEEWFVALLKRLFDFVDKCLNPVSTWLSTLTYGLSDKLNWSDGGSGTGIWACAQAQLTANISAIWNSFTGSTNLIKLASWLFRSLQHSLKSLVPIQLYECLFTVKKSAGMVQQLLHENTMGMNYTITIVTSVFFALPVKMGNWVLSKVLSAEKYGALATMCTVDNKVGDIFGMLVSFSNNALTAVRDITVIMKVVQEVYSWVVLIFPCLWDYLKKTEGARSEDFTSGNICCMSDMVKAFNNEILNAKRSVIQGARQQNIDEEKAELAKIDGELVLVSTENTKEILSVTEGQFVVPEHNTKEGRAQFHKKYNVTGGIALNPNAGKTEEVTNVDKHTFMNPNDLVDKPISILNKNNERINGTFVLKKVTEADTSWFGTDTWFASEKEVKQLTFVEAPPDDIEGPSQPLDYVKHDFRLSTKTDHISHLKTMISLREIDEGEAWYDRAVSNVSSYKTGASEFMSDAWTWLGSKASDPSLKNFLDTEPCWVIQYKTRHRPPQIRCINFYRFKWKVHTPLYANDPSIHFGVDADEFETHFPACVSIEPSTGYKYINIKRFVPKVIKDAFLLAHKIKQREIRDYS